MVQTKTSTSMLQFYSHLFPLMKYLKFKISLEACFFFLIRAIINPFRTGKIEKLDFWGANNYTKFKDQ